MEYIKKYETVSKFNEVEGGESITSVIPGVGYVVENRKSYYNPQGPGPTKSYKVELYYVSHEESKATEKEEYIRNYECTDNPYVIEEKLVKTWLSEIGTDKFEMIAIKSHKSVIDAKCQKMLADKYEGKFDGDSFIFSIKGGDGKLPIDLTDAVYDYGFAVYVHDTVPKTYDVNTYLDKDGKTSMIESLQRSEMYYWVENSDIKRWLNTAGLDSYSNIKCEISRDWVTEETFKELSKMELEHLYDNFYSFVIKEDGVKLTLTDSIYGRKINITVYAPVEPSSEVTVLTYMSPLSSGEKEIDRESTKDLTYEIRTDVMKQHIAKTGFGLYEVKCYVNEKSLTDDTKKELAANNEGFVKNGIYNFKYLEKPIKLGFTKDAYGDTLKIYIYEVAGDTYETEVWYISGGFPYSACSFARSELNMDINYDDIKKWMAMSGIDSWSSVKGYVKQDWLTKDCIGKLKDWKLDHDDIFSFTIPNEGVSLEFTTSIYNEKFKIEVFLK